MADSIRFKRGTSAPGSLSTGEPAVDITNAILYVGATAGVRAVAMTTATQTLTNKTLSGPVISGITSLALGGDNPGDMYVRNTSNAFVKLPSTSSTLGDLLTITDGGGGHKIPGWVTLTTLSGIAITGGTINNAVIGGATPAAGTFTSLASPSLIGGTASGDDLALSSTSHGTKGNINIGTDSTYDEVNGRLGIGTLTPAARLTVSDTSTASSRGGELYQIESSSTSCQLRLLKARGTEATPTAIQSGDVLGTFTFAGHNGTAFVNAANIRVYATENWDGTHRGVAMTIGTAPTGSNANTLHFQLDEFGMTLLAVGQGYKVKEGSNACMGAATLSGGTVTVSTTKVTTSSRIFLTVQSLGTVTVPKAIGVTARTASTSFTITSADATDTSVVAWEIKEPSP